MKEEPELPGVGVFGTSLTAQAIIYLLQLQGFKIEAIWGKTEEEASNLAQELSIPFSTSKIDDVLLKHEVELACIKCPPLLQYQIAEKTLRIGKMVMCDSPAGLCLSDAQRVVEAARYYPSLLSLITYYLRFLPTFVEMKKRISDSYIGNVQIIEVRVHCGLTSDVQFNWFHDQRAGGGFLHNFGAHFIDVVSFVTGQKAKKVHGILKTFRPQTDKVSGFREITSDDYCSFQMQMEDKNTFCDCTFNNNVPGDFNYEVLIIGSQRAHLRVKNGVLYGKQHDATSEEILKEDPYEILKALKSPFSNDKQLPAPFITGMVKFVEALKEALQKENGGGRLKWNEGALSLAATSEDTLYVQSVLESICRSNRTCLWEQVSTTNDQQSLVPSPSANLSIKSMII